MSISNMIINEEGYGKSKATARTRMSAYLKIQIDYGYCQTLRSPFFSELYNFQVVFVFIEPTTFQAGFISNTLGNTSLIYSLTGS